MLVTTALIYIVDIIGDSRILLELFVKIILEVPLDIRLWALFSEESPDDYQFVIPSDKSFKYKTNINSKVIQSFSF